MLTILLMLNNLSKQIVRSIKYRYRTCCFEPFHPLSRFFPEKTLTGFRVTRFKFFIGEILLSMLYSMFFLFSFGIKSILQFLRSKQFINEC